MEYNNRLIAHCKKEIVLWISILAIFVGGYAVLAPKRTKDLARLGFRALFAATLACLMTGAVAGVFIKTGSTTILRF